MKNSQDILIVLLLATAAILAGLVVSVHTADRAYAEPSAKGGGYIVASGRVSSDMDLLYVIDVGARKLNCYGYSIQTKQLELGRQPIDLAQLFGD